MPDDPNRVAVMYGPLVLAGDLGSVQDSNAHDPLYVPILLTDERDPSGLLKAVEGEINTFRTAGIGKPRDVVLKPFYKTHERRYTVYWDLFDEEGWTEREQEYKANIERQKKIEEMTIDFVQLGEMQPERDHNFDGERTSAREFRGKRMRSSRNGWFSVDMDVFKGQPMALVVEYWGGFPGSKTFDILVDGELQSRSWKTDEGHNRSIVEIKARRIQFLNKRGIPVETEAEDVSLNKGK